MYSTAEIVQVMPTTKKNRGSHDSDWLCLDKLFSKTGDGVMAINEQGKILYTNPALDKILDLKGKAHIGKACHSILKGHDETGNLYCYINYLVMIMAKRTQPVNRVNLQFQDSSGQIRWISLSAFTQSLRGKNHQRVIIHLLRPTKLPQKEPGSRMPLEYNPILKEAYLTDREIQILQFLIEGMVARKISTLLDVSYATIRTHIQRILKKLGVHTQLEAVVLATRQKF